MNLYEVKTRRLATANRSRASCPVTTIFGQCSGVVDPVKIFLSYSLIITQNLVTVSRARIAYSYVVLWLFTDSQYSSDTW